MYVHARDPANKEGKCHDARVRAVLTVVCFRPIPSRPRRSKPRIAERDPAPPRPQTTPSTRPIGHSRTPTQKNGAGFSNYLLDQTVICGLQDPGANATVWNRTADFWRKAFPDRIEEAPNSQYLKGPDFRGAMNLDHCPDAAAFERGEAGAGQADAAITDANALDAHATDAGGARGDAAVLADSGEDAAAAVDAGRGATVY